MKKLILNAGGMGADPDGIQAVADLFANCKRVAIIPYAYCGEPQDVLAGMKKLMPGVNWVSLDENADHRDTLATCDGIWCTGGNSLVLADQLFARQMLDPVRKMVENGIPYAGSSAGANAGGPSMCTTNDMPILLQQRSMETFWLVPFQINPHYLDGSERPKDYRGEARPDRIREFLQVNDVPVVALREGSWLSVEGDKMLLNGKVNAVVFERRSDGTIAQREVLPGVDMSALLKVTPRFNVPSFGGLSL